MPAYEKKGRHGRGALLLVLLRGQHINLGHLEAHGLSELDDFDGFGVRGQRREQQRRQEATFGFIAV